MRADEFCDPLRRFLTELGLKLDFQDTIGEQLFVFGSELLERMVDPDIHSPPVISCSCAAVPIILADHGQFGVERDTDTSISWELESSSVVESAHDCGNEG